MSTDMRERYAEAAARWALMYPIASWRLAKDDKAELLAKVWGDQIALHLTEDVRDEEMEQLRAERDALKAERDDARAAIERVETYLADIEDHCSANRYDVPSWVGSVRLALDTPTAPESPGGGERIADERPVGVHVFEQNPAATQISVCICGKWRDHHVHGADPCGCDECRAASESPESEETTDG